MVFGHPSHAGQKIETVGSPDKYPLPRGVSVALADLLVQALMAAHGVDRLSVEALMRRMEERLAKHER